MKIKVPAKTVEACDICKRECTGSLLTECVVCGKEYCHTCEAIMSGCIHQPDVCKRCAENKAVQAAVKTFAPSLVRALKARDVVLAGLGAAGDSASDRKRKSANAEAHRLETANPRSRPEKGTV